MFSSIWQDIKSQFSHGNMLTRIILVNIGMFLFVLLGRLLLYHIDDGETYRTFLHFFTISSDWKHNLTHPWVIVTHMFLHEDFGHILWNMVLLYWFGRIVGDLWGDRKVLPIYLLGGLAGGLAYFLVANLPTPWDFGGYALGASAAFMATIMVAGMTAPDYPIHLIFIGEVRLKFIVAVFMLLDLVAISWNNNSGGAFAHLGGATMGYFIVRSRTDLTAPVNRVLDTVFGFFANLFSKKKPQRPKVVHRSANIKQQQRPAARSNQRSSDDRSQQEQIDAILDKIKQSGYESLSPSEKEFLFNASRKP